MGKLTEGALKRLIKKPGRHLDGQGLFYRVLGEGKSYFVYRYRVAGKEREMSLGPHPETTLDQARAKHAEMRAKVKSAHIDPLAEKRANRAAAAKPSVTPTFGKIADDYYATHKASWKNDKHRYQWRMTLTTFCAPIRERPVDQIDTEMVLTVLRPLWSRVPETASRSRNRIEIVLDAARALGHIDPNRANPARWRGHLDKLLPNPRKTGKPRRNHPAMPYAEVPAFLAKLKRTPGSATKALAFTILTASRSGEVFGAKWDELDLEGSNGAGPTWVVPAERMKMGQEHRVPLSDAALDILRGQLKARGKNPYVFPSAIGQGRGVHRDGSHYPLSNMAFAMLMRRMKAGDFTPHGFRSAFRDWAGDETHFPREVAEAALAHKVGDKAEQAYRRGDALKKRRDLMEAWARHCFPTSAKVVSMAGRKRR
jgi:integrase